MTRLASLAILAAFSATQLPAQSLPLITPKDFGKWEQLGAFRLSPRGDWAAVSVARVDEENQLRLRGGPRDTTVILEYGSAPAFSADNKWVAYAVGVSPKERDRLTKEKKPVRNSLGFRSLAGGPPITVAEISAFSFSPDGRFLSMTRYPAEGKKVTEVLVQNLAAGTRLSFSSVGEQAWADVGSVLALAIETDGGVGNAVQLYAAETGTVRVLESSNSQYRGLAWRPRSTDLAVLRTRVDQEFKDTAHVLLAWTAITTPEPEALSLDPAKADGFPAGMRIADGRRPSWSRDGRIVFFGIRRREPRPDSTVKKSEEKVSDVEIWHPNDVRMLRQQMGQEAEDLRATLLTAWRVSDRRVIPIGTDIGEQSLALEGGRWATEVDRKPYGWGWKFGRLDRDVWVTDLATGERRKVLTQVRHYFGANPAGTRLGWSDGKDFWVLDLASGAKTNVTAALTNAKRADFVDRDDDHPNNVAPVIFPAGWARDGSWLLNDGYDVWSVALDGSGGKRLTDGAQAGVVHRLVSFVQLTASADERAFDTTKPLYFSVTGKKSKASGYAVRNADGTINRLVFGDASYRALAKADSAAVFGYTRQRYDESPSLLLGADIAQAKPTVLTNAHQKEYAWGKVELFNFRSTIGMPLQSLLYYPANYDPARTYPMIVYTYERLTQDYHTYIVPRETSYYNTTVFTQNGYFVLMPDIVFRPREPGLGTLQAVEGAVRSVLARGIVDPARVGHVGHSQGGYEAAYLGTHSKLFATTIAGSGITDMVSFAGQLHWSGGSAEFDHWETGQFRMEVAPWEDMQAMLANSPLNKVQDMPAKSMLLEVGADDGVVDPRQGSLFYNYARRAGKHVVLLMYPGEGHGLSKKENQIDYERRILQWFGHYLKGEPAPAWITDGQPALERRANLEANKTP